jgi:aminoglycoside 6'-N-acetyltransferase
MEIVFRPLGLTDFSLMLRWLREPQVARWYFDEAELSDDDLMEKWRGRADGDLLVRRFIISVDGTDIGQIQTCKLADEPEYDAEVGVPGAAGVDLLIGEPDYRDRGVGTQMLGELLRQIVFTDPEIDVCTIDPEPENTRAIRCYAKVGFRHVRTYHSKVSGVDVYLMTLRKSDHEQRGA